VRRLWHWFIKRLDWFDDRIIGHRIYWFCNFVCEHYPDEEGK